jgi:thiol-disulfide isomerase/thioredoxin
MKSYQKNIITALSLIISYIIFGTITYGDHSLMLLLFLTTNFFISIKIFQTNTSSDAIKSILILISPIMFIFLMLILIYNQYSRTILYIIFLPISSAMAYAYFKYKHTMIVFCSLGIFGIVGYVLFQNVLILVENQNAEMNIRYPLINFKDENNKTINFDKDKIIVLDFWTTSCAICFTKFPDLEKTYLKYKNHPDVMIYSVNVPLRNDKLVETRAILNKLGYTFPKIYAASSKQIADSLKVNSFPHMIILKGGRIRYNGIFESEKKVAFYNIEGEIEKLMVEKSK